MKLNTVLPALLLLATPLAAYACPSGNPDVSPAYMRRDNNRCEGLNSYKKTSAKIELVSFSTTQLGENLPSVLEIRVPGGISPSVVAQSDISDYRLDELTLRSGRSYATFPLKTKILEQAGIKPKDLQAVAFVIQDNTPVYYPVVLGKPSRAYQFIVLNPEETSFPIFEIRPKGKTKAVYQRPRKIAREGLIPLKWEYGQAKDGIYELYIQNSKGETQSFLFVHKRSWW